MKRRVAIARALIHQPELILYDSPTGGLDPVTSTTIIELVMKQRDVYRTPSILVTHRLQDAFTLCTHRFDPERGHMVRCPKAKPTPGTTFLMLEEGRLIFDGSLHELLHTDNKFVKSFWSKAKGPVRDQKPETGESGTGLKLGAPSIPQSHRGMGGKPQISSDRLRVDILEPSWTTRISIPPKSKSAGPR
jgi:ABC-type multidrug transport system ATPase subunit